MPVESIALFISLYLDEDISRNLAAMLRAKDFDAISAHELGQTGDQWDDARHLAYAAENGRALLGFNRDDYIVLDHEYRQSGREHYGIIIAKQLPIGELARQVLRLLDSVTADEMKGTFRYL